MLRLEVRNASVPIEKKPSWIKTTARMGPEYRELQQLVKSEELHTVCQEAGCPNIFECWEDREATFLIGGDQCTRRCDFCQIDTGKPADFDTGEPLRVAESVQNMGLRYATVTGVCRDDLPDEGAWLYAETIRQIHRLNPDTGVEMLAPDFSGNLDYLGQLFAAAPEVFAHNLETVPRIFRRIRPGFRYERSLRCAAGIPRRRTGHQVEPDPGAWVRPAPRSRTRCGICTTPAPRSSPSRSTSGPLPDTIRSTAGSGPRSSSSSRPSRIAGLRGCAQRAVGPSSYRAGRLYRKALENREQLDLELVAPAGGQDG